MIYSALRYRISPVVDSLYVVFDTTKAKTYEVEIMR